MLYWLAPSVVSTKGMRWAMSEKSCSVIMTSVSQNVHLREEVTYTNYHRFRSSIQVFYAGKNITNNAKKAKKQPSPAPPSQQPTTVPQSAPPK